MKSSRACCLLALLACISGNPARAADGTWSASSGGAWETAANWSGATIASGSGATATFANDPTGTRSVTLSAARTIGKFSFSDSDPATPGGWSLGGAGTLTLAVSSGVPDLKVNALAAGQAVSISAPMAGAGFSKSGPGTLVLSGNNNFATPDITFAAGDSGIVRLASSQALGGIATVNLPGTSSSVSRIELDGNIALSANLTTAGRGASAFLRNIAGNNAWNGSIAISNSGGGYAIESQADTLTLGGPISNGISATRSLILTGVGNGVVSGVIANGGGALSIEKNNTGTWKFAGQNSYSGTTSIGGGTLEIGTGGRPGTGAIANQGALQITSGSDLVLANAISGTGSLRIAGTGSLTLGGNSSYAGGTTASGAGNLSVASDTGFGTGSVILGDAPGSAQLWFQAAGDRTLANDFEIRTQRWIIDTNTINGNAAGTVTITGSVSFNQAGAKDIYLNRPLVLAGAVTSTGGFIKRGGSKLTFAGNATIPGATTIYDNEIAVDGTLAGGTVTINTGATLSGGGAISNSVIIGSGATLTPGNSSTGTLATGPLTLASGSLLRLTAGAPSDSANTSLAVTGNLSLNGKLTFLSRPGITSGLYPLATYTGNRIGSGFQSIDAPAGFIASLVTSTPGVLKLRLLDAGAPTPASNIMLSMTGPLDLAWSAPPDAIGYDVYLGTSSSAVGSATPATTGIYKGQTTATSYSASGFTSGTVNYWRIDYRFSDGSTFQGPVWNFTLVDDHDLMQDTWVATDALDRTLPQAAEAGPPRDSRPTAIFYFLWHNKNSLGSDGPRDTAREIDRLGGYTNKKLPWNDNPKWMEGGSGRSWYWGEPDAGYYSSDDDWVIRRHIMLLTAAGVDILAFDNTNGQPATYKDNYIKIAETIRAMRKEGMKIDLKFMFLTHSGNGGSPATATWLYENFYKPGLYPEMWLMWDGKPAIVGYPDGLGSGEAPVSSEVRNFFTWRTGWANVSSSQLHDEWQWIDSTTPQNWGYHNRADIPEQVAVACGGWCNNNLGRSYYNRSQPAYDNFHLTPARTENLGKFFSEQAAYGLKLDPELLFVTGWNEWWAGSWTAPTSGGGYNILDNNCAPGQRYFVDNYNSEYSRDIEPMKGGFGDNYYYQLVAANRLRKGVRTVPFASAAVAAAPTDFANVGPVYRDAPDETIARNAPTTFSNLPNYINTTGRNDFRVLKVARDAANLYFYAETKNSVTAATGANWMNLYLDIDSNRATGWEGYDYVINYGAPGRISSLAGPGWNPATIGTATFSKTGNKLIVTIPRATVGLGADPLKVDFHWTDNIQTAGDISDFGTSGDSAPERRFNYRYQTRPVENVVLQSDGFESGQQASWGETYNSGTQWQISSSTPFAGSKCLIGSGKSGSTDASGTLINRTSTVGLDSFQVRFRYKLGNVKDAQNIQIYFRSSTGQWVAVSEIGRDQFHPAGQAWGYDEKQSVWLNFSDSRLNTGADATWFHPDFAVHIQIKGLTSATQTVAIDDFQVTGTRAIAAPEIATSPTPANAATRAGLAASLGWAPGAAADSQQVWFGAPGNPVLVATLPGTTSSFTPPGQLGFSTAYAWRVDSINAAGTTTGTTWTFTTTGPALPATSPAPANGAVEIVATSSLGWVPGAGMDSQQLYFGTPGNLALVATLSGTASSFTPPAQLGFSTTYAWRIDSTNPAGTATGPIWTFTTTTPPELAGAPVPANGVADFSVDAPLGWTPGARTNSQKVYLGAAGNPVLVATLAGNVSGFAPPAALDFSTSYTWRIDSINAAGTTAGVTWTFTTISPPESATAPAPANGEPGIAVDAALGWTPGSGADSQVVWFGTAGNLAQMATLTGTESSFAPPAQLEFSTAYSWRIDSTNAAGTAASATWNFTTAAPLNSSPTLAAIADFNVIAGQSVDFTAAASDPDGQALAFALEGAPAGAAIDATSGIFHWRPAMSQAPGAYPITATATDTGSPPLSAQRSFTVNVAVPAMPAVLAHSRDADGTFRMQIGGDFGPDYRVWISENLSDWSLLETVPAPAPPFWFVDPAAKDQPTRFYRLELGP